MSNLNLQLYIACEFISLSRSLKQYMLKYLYQYIFSMFCDKFRTPTVNYLISAKALTGGKSFSQVSTMQYITEIQMWCICTCDHRYDMWNVIHKCLICLWCAKYNMIWTSHPCIEKVLWNVVHLLNLCQSFLIFLFFVVY